MARDPECFVNNETQFTHCKFSVAVSRGKKDGKDLGADFPSCVAFGKTAQFVDKYFRKGQQIALEGHLATGSYENKEGQKVYTTDVIVDKVEFVGSKEDKGADAPKEDTNKPDIPAGFELAENDDIPFD